MTRIEQSIFIHATPAEIDRVALVPQRIPEWYVGVKSIHADGLFPEVNGRVTFVLDVAGVNVNVDIVSSKLERGECFMYHMEGMLIGVTRWVHTPEEGCTRLTVTQQYQLAGGALGKLANQLLIEHKLSEDLLQSLRNLAVLVESERAFA